MLDEGQSLPLSKKLWKRAAEHGVVASMNTNCTHSLQKWAWLRVILDPSQKFARGQSAKILSPRNLPLHVYGNFPLPFCTCTMNQASLYTDQWWVDLEGVLWVPWNPPFEGLPSCILSKSAQT